MINRIVGVFVVLTLIVGFVALYFGSLASLGENLSAVSTGNTTVDGVVVALVIVVLLAGTFFFLDLIFDIFEKRGD